MVLKRTAISMLAACLLAAAIPAVAEAGHYVTITYRPFFPQAAASRGPSPYAAVRRQMSSAQTELTRAYAAAGKTNALANELKAAQAAAEKAKQDYAAALTTARAAMAADPVVTKLRHAEREALARKESAGSDAKSLLACLNELAAVRKTLKAAEDEIIGIDAELAVSKAAVAEAALALRDVETRRQAAVRQDPAVQAATQRLAALRQQLAAIR